MNSYASAYAQALSTQKQHILSCEQHRFRFFLFFIIFFFHSVFFSSLFFHRCCCCFVIVLLGWLPYYLKRLKNTSTLSAALRCWCYLSCALFFRYFYGFFSPISFPSSSCYLAFTLHFNSSNRKKKYNIRMSYNSLVFMLLLTTQPLKKNFERWYLKALRCTWTLEWEFFGFVLLLLLLWFLKSKSPYRTFEWNQWWRCLLNMPREIPPMLWRHPDLNRIYGKFDPPAMKTVATAAMAAKKYMRINLMVKSPYDNVNISGENVWSGCENERYKWWKWGKTCHDKSLLLFRGNKKSEHE